MQCVACAVENSNDRRYCAACGAVLPLVCETCGFVNQSDAVFCGGCGRHLAPAGQGALESRAVAPSQLAGELRQVTVLFVDLAGYTTLSSGRDPEEVHRLLGNFFETVDGLIESHGGTIDKHIGDAVMALFGAPIAHGNDTERALRAALAIHQALEQDKADGPPLRAHIGVASGQVLASGTGSGRHREYTVTGETVNLASRLDEMATPGETLISDAVYRSLSHLVEAESLGEVTVRGLAKPVQVWRLLALREAGAATRQSLFVGRSGQIAQFEGIASACREQGSGQALLIRGEAGIGKSRLVEEFVARGQQQGFASHKALVLDFGVGKGQDPIRALARSLLGIAPGSGKPHRQAAADRAIDKGLLAMEQQVFLADLLDLPQSDAQRTLYDAMDNATRTRGRQEAMAALLRGVSAEQPLLILIEDIHWSDHNTLADLASLASAAADCSVVLVMTTRSEGDPVDQAWRSAAGACPVATMDLGPLRDEEAEKMAADLMAGAASVVRNCVERAGGNPLFLEQLLRNAQETTTEELPASVQSLVLARIDRLGATDKAALQAASVIGQRFTLDILRALLEDPGYSCARLIANGLVRREANGFLFAHALIREGVYASLLRARRRDYHRRAAASFAGHDALLAAQHLDRAEDPAAPRAYLRAAEEQAAQYRYDAAARCVERGLALATDRSDRFALACLQGDILHDLGEMTGAGQAYEAALQAAQGCAETCRSWIGLAAVKRVTEDLDGALADLARAEKDAVEEDLTGERARIHFLRGNLLFPRGDIEGCLQQHRLSFELAREAHSAELEAAALGGLGDAEYARGRMISAHDHLQRCVELARKHGFGRIEVANLAQMAHAQLYFRPQDEALAQARAAAVAAARVGHSRAELNARVAASFAHFVLQQLDDCREEIEKARGLLRRLGTWRFEQPCLLYLGRIAHAKGLRAEAVQYLREALRVGQATGASFHGASILGSLALVLDEAQERRRVLQEGEALIAAGCVSHNQLRFYPDAIEAALDLADHGEAERYAAALEAFTRPEPLPWSDFYIAYGRALAARGRGERSAALAEEIARLRDEGTRLGLRSALPLLN